jgi:hypothetical protein
MSPSNLPRPLRDVAVNAPIRICSPRRTQDTLAVKVYHVVSLLAVFACFLSAMLFGAAFACALTGGQ